MKIKELKLFTNQIETEKKFYLKTLGFEVVTENENQFSFKVGWSIFTFIQSSLSYNYHYCFLIPSNKLNEAFEWINKRVDVLDIEDGIKIVNFETWNADSFYFYDGSGNLAEFIVRYDLKNENLDDFDISSVIGINEIGIGTTDVEKTNSQLEKELGTKFWKGDLNRFATNGSQEGLFLIPNYELKEIWYPTKIKIKAEPFEAIIENNNKIYSVKFKNGKIKTTINSDMEGLNLD